MEVCGVTFGVTFGVKSGRIAPFKVFISDSSEHRLHAIDIMESVRGSIHLPPYLPLCDREIRQTAELANGV